MTKKKENIQITVLPHPLFDCSKGGKIIGTATGREYDTISELVANEPFTILKYPKKHRKEYIMTDEQIKQNAEEYADKLWEDGRCTESTAPTIQEIYIAGAHSRDEEINELQTELESLRKGFYERGDKLKELMLANNKLRNPWISVEDRLPEEGENVLVYCTKYEEVFQAWLCDNKWMGAPIGEEVSHWMPIPETPKGGEK